MLPYTYAPTLAPHPPLCRCRMQSLEGRPLNPASPSPGSRASLPPLISGHNQRPSRDPAINSAPSPSPGAPGWLTVRPTPPKPGSQQWERVITVSVSEPRLLPLPRPDSGSTGKRSGPGGCDGGREGAVWRDSAFCCGQAERWVEAGSCPADGHGETRERLCVRQERTTRCSTRVCVRGCVGV